ncbi:MAG: hypothetical protein IJI59_07800 [Clostridia bacterium]|nr:hypothetical protein [Clostridia bacterium]
MTSSKSHWLRTTIVVLLICGIVGLALTAAMFFGKPDKTTASANIQFTFEGAPEGLAPNGRPFNISEIASDEVLTTALREAGLEGTYTPEQLRVCLTARGVFPKDMVDQVTSYASLLDFTTSRSTNVGDYHPTVFDVSLSSDFDKSIPKDKLVALMQNILVAFRNRFAQVYANGLETESLLFTLDQYDYPQQLEILQNHYEMISEYAMEVYAWKPIFRWQGVGFNDISVRLNNLINSDIGRLNADLTMNALTKDTVRLLTRYQFEIRDLNNQLQKQREHLEKMDAIIDKYSKNEIIYLSTADSLTKIDGNSSETYDALVDRRKMVADDITDINSRISEYQLKLADLIGEDAFADQKADVASVEADAASVEADAASVEADAASVEADAGQTAEEALTDVVEMTEAEIAQAAEDAERETQAQKDALEKNLSALVEKGQGILNDFKAMLEAFNQEQINELNLAATSVRYNAPRVLSGAFVKKAIMVAGPICTLGFLACMLMIFISRKREGRF